MPAESFLRERFADYYKRNIIGGPPNVMSREFGFGEFGKKISSRHLSFSGVEELNSFLRTNVPFYISYSTAYYSFPAARPMQAKQMQKADLIYEFDADDIKTDCKELHDSWKCSSCGESGAGLLKNCPNCGSGVSVDEWVCPECLNAVKLQVKRLLGFFESDFGITEGFFLNYSGSKGFHIHLRSDAFSGLSAQARIELVDYLTAHEIDFEKLGFVFSKKTFSCPKYGGALGWSGRIMNWLFDKFDTQSIGELDVVSGVPSKDVKVLIDKKNEVLDGFRKGFLYPLAGKKNQAYWSNLLEFIVSRQKLDLDRQTSVDVSKIIRVPNTIHGGTGLVAKEFLLAELDKFDGLADSVVFGDKPFGLKSVIAPKFYLGKKWWGPFAQEDVALPEFVAVYLLAKGHAQLA